MDLALQRKYGVTIKELDEKYGSRISSDKALYTDLYSDIPEFPSAKVKNWDLLRKHTINEFICADDTKYEQRFRRIRVSKDSRSIDAYLRSMYKLDGADMYACQMCHERVHKFEKNQIHYNMVKELDALYLCLCPNCATKYITLRNDTYGLDKFISEIKNLDEDAINSQDPVKIGFKNASIWFTQRHIAEIKELMKLQDDEDKYQKTVNISQKSAIVDNQPKKKVEKVILYQKEPYLSATSNIKENSTKDDNPKIEESEAVTDDWSKYIGKRILHKADGYGVIKTCEGDTIGIEFKKGKRAGIITNFSLSELLSKNMIRIVE